MKGACVCVCVCTHTYIPEYYSAIKKNWIFSFASTWKDLEGIILSEIIQTEKDKYHMISLTCVIQKTKQMNDIIKQKLSYGYREQTGGFQRGGGGGRNEIVQRH